MSPQAHSKSHASPGSGSFANGPRLWAALSAALVGMVALILAFSGWNEEGLRAAIRWTARTSFVLFLLAFTASNLRRRWGHPLTAWQLRNRRALGLSFATSHYLHMAAILSLALAVPAFRTTVDWITIVFGGVVGYALITAMVVTSNDAAVRRLGRARWRRLHVIGSYFLWFIFFQSYAGRLATEASVASACATLLALAALGLRLAPSKSAQRSQTVPA